MIYHINSETSFARLAELDSLKKVSALLFYMFHFFFVTQTDA